jgi:hexokinase
MPGTNGYVNEEQFFGIIADIVLPLLKDTKIEGIGFTFSYPMEITADADGILLEFSKEVNAPDVIGKAIGKGLREALAVKNCKYDGPIVLLNDTVSTLLSGLASTSPDFKAGSGSVIGFILGTGFNTAYPEVKIPKINFDSVDSPQVVVCETGNFNVINRGQLDIEYDNTTKNPGSYILEKTASGAYLGPLTLHILKQAVKDKVIRFNKSDEFLAMPHLETKILNDFITTPIITQGTLGTFFGPDESSAVAAVQYITSIVTERAALLSAAVLAATVQRTNPGFEGYSPVRIAVEGSTYMLFKGMRRAIESFLHQMLFQDKPRPYIISPVEQASLFGAAVAALSRKN